MPISPRAAEWCRVPQLRCAQRKAKPVHDGARMRRGVSQRVRAPEHVVFVPHPGIAPPIGAEEVKVSEGAEGLQCLLFALGYSPVPNIKHCSRFAL